MYTPWVASSLLLFAAIPGLPYGYYQLLRLLICGMSCYGITLAHSHNYKYYKYIFIVIALVFNPLLPIHLNRAMWLPIDILSGLFFVATHKLFLLSRRT